jgi:hypothetical protein
MLALAVASDQIRRFAMPASRSISHARPLGASPSAQIPPRYLDWPLRARLLLGGKVAQFGWVWLIVASLFSWVFLADTDIGALVFNFGERASAQGTIVASWETDSSSNDQSVYAYSYTFVTPADEQTYDGVSYTIPDSSVGKTVIVDYHVNNPRNSRIRGMGQAPFGPGMLLILGLPLVGLLLAGFAMRQGWQAIRLLSRGRLSQGRLLTNTRTNMEVMEKPVHQLVIGFADDAGANHTIRFKTTNLAMLDAPYGTHVLYNPARPEDALALGSLPAQPLVRPDGSIELTTPLRTTIALALPPLALLVIGVIAWSLAR